jgi:hypothetical protein
LLGCFQGGINDMSTGSLYCMALVTTDVSENISFHQLINSESTVTQLWNPITCGTLKMDMFSETSVLTHGTKSQRISMTWNGVSMRLTSQSQQEFRSS